MTKRRRDARDLLRDARARITLDQWIHDSESEWPNQRRPGTPAPSGPTCAGFRLRRGRVVWTVAYYPDGCAGHLVAVSRIVHEDGQTFSRVAYVDRDTPIEFVYEPVAPAVQS